MAKRRIPQIDEGAKILIICEGYEEYDYFDRLKSLQVWDKKFCIEIENAKSIDNIFAKYQYRYANNNYKLVFIFCDTETKPYEQFIALKNKIDKMHGNDASNEILFFGNPCTMQIILSHFAKVSLKTNSKNKNSQKIEKLTGVCEYRAIDKQRKQVMQQVNKLNYDTMKSNLTSCSKNFKDTPSTNVLELFNNLEKYDKKWITKLNNLIEK